MSFYLLSFVNKQSMFDQYKMNVSKYNETLISCLNTANIAHIHIVNLSK